MEDIISYDSTQSPNDTGHLWPSQLLYYYGSSDEMDYHNCQLCSYIWLLTRSLAQASQKIVPGVYAVDMHEIMAHEDGENDLHNMFSEMPWSKFSDNRNTA